MIFKRQVYLCKNNLGLTLAFIFFCIEISAQNQNNIWMLGAFYNSAFPKCGVDFNSGQADTFSVYREMPFFITEASICDTSGQLLFYTNGIYVANKNHDTLLNGADFNPGYQTNVNHNDGLSSSQGALILPLPNDPMKYIIFHETGEPFILNNVSEVQPFHLSYSVVDMSLDSGNGGIIPGIKNIPVLQDTLVWGRITACRHGNGRDWWIIVPRFHTNKYFKILLTPTGIDSVSAQQIGHVIMYDVLGTGVFSPEGDKYAVVAADNQLSIFQFDRCTGQFFDSVYIQVPNPTMGQPDNEPFSCVFSPSGQFLYVILYTKILQYDTWASNISSSMVTVAEWDTLSAPFYTYFFMSERAPDGRIYISTYGGNYVLHYIEFPDLPGMSCNVVQNNFWLPRANITLPNMVNLELGPVSGSICDSLNGVTDFQNPLVEISVFPNPAKDHFFVCSEENTTITIELRNITGVLINRFPLLDDCIKNYTTDLKSGVYFWVAHRESFQIASGKLIIMNNEMK